MIVSNLPQAKSGSFLQRRSVMPGGGGKCNGANVEGRVEMVQMALCLQCYVYIYRHIYWWAGRYFGKISPWDGRHLIGYEVLQKLSGRCSEMGEEVQVQLFHKCYKTTMIPKVLRSSGVN